MTILPNTLSYTLAHCETNGVFVNILNWKEVRNANHYFGNIGNKNLFGLLSSLKYYLWTIRTRYADNNIGLKAKLLFLIRTCLHPKISLGWYSFLHQSYLRNAVQANTSLLDAIHRPFFDRLVPLDKRLTLMQNHFHLCEVFFGKVAASEILAGKAREIAQITGKNGAQFRLALFWGCAYKREGGLTVGLFLEDTLLQCLTFSFDLCKNQIAIKVGGIQANNQESQNLIRTSTKALYGIQPRLLLIEALRCLAREFNCISIECVAKKNHIYQALRYKFSKNIKAEYDQLWLAAGSTQHVNGNFMLPLSLAEKPLSSRPANKRSEYRARDKIIQAMRNEISKRLPAN
ncbi:DUF535 family protein [Undibacterium sp. Rencai35W]|uniref:DUF535 family protein n=1 Tax=Undibacterium sp. Rencai35W TaxID=3413046 RepID=UPI003BF06DA6